VKQATGTIFVITGPSGSGKTTILKKLLKSKGLGKILLKSVSFTTRPKRTGEKNSADYCFINVEEFKQKKRAKKFLEWTKYLGYYYATPKDFIEKRLKEGRAVILCLDLKGALTIKRMYPKNAVTIFIVPPSLETLRDRIEKRSRNTKVEEIIRRTQLARKELRASHRYDYSVINQDLKLAAREIKSIILNKISKKI
jgi:guanylate kinase